MRIKKTLSKIAVAGILSGVVTFAPNVVDLPIIPTISIAHAQEDVYMQKIDECTSLMIQKKYNDVINICNELIQSYPNRWNAYERRSFNYKNMRQFDKALEDINKAMELAPDESQNYWTKIYIYGEMHKSDEVKKCREQLIELYTTKLIPKEPNNSKYYTERAITYDELGEYQKAIADYKKAVTLPHHVDENTKKLMESFGEKYDENTIIAGEYFLCGEIYKKIKDYSNAVEMYAKAVELHPENPIYWQLRGQCYEALGEKDKAKADYVEYQVRSRGGK